MATSTQQPNSADYWKTKLANFARTELSPDRPRQPAPSFMRSQEHHSLPVSAAKVWLGGLKRRGVTVEESLIAAVQMLVARYTRQDDILIGAVWRDSDGRPDMLALRTQLESTDTPAQIGLSVRALLAELEPHRDMSFIDVLSELAIAPSLERAPLFQVALVIQGVAGRLAEKPITDDDLFDVAMDLNACDLVMTVKMDGDDVSLGCDFNSELYEPATVRRLLGHLSWLLISATENPDTDYRELAFMTKAETQLVVHEWNATARAFYQPMTLHEQFQSQVEETPDAVALQFDQSQLSYRELNERANQLARELLKQNGPELLVGVFLERSFDLIVALYAVLKAGGAYVPLDPEYPTDRIDHMIRDSKCQWVLTQDALADRLPAGEFEILRVDAQWSAIEKNDHTNVNAPVAADDLAYVIYTSGTTGLPKGAMNEHRGICNRICGMQQAFALDAKDVVLHKTPYSFDVSVWELFWPLTVGARMVIAEPGGHKDAAYLSRLIQAAGVTTLHFVPSMLQVFLDEGTAGECKSIKRAICSGEALPRAAQLQFFDTLDAQLHNLYGPTEAAIDVTWWPCDRDDARDFVPIGRPVTNVQIYLLNERLQPVPIGVPGELHIGGVQVGRGYLNRDELTAEKFTPDPFSDIEGARLYKTGDLARFHEDGVIEYLGRIDSQVKVRGFRIELGEIENVLGQHEDVKQAAAVARADEALGQRLLAFYVANDLSSPTVDELRGYLQTRLPDFMVPTRLIQIDALPLTPNGKLDRGALPDADALRPALASELVMPRSEVEQRIAALWQDLLQMDQVGVSDNFFDLGGHSLLLAQMRTALKEQFGRDIAMVDLFQYPTVAALAGFLRPDVGAEDAAESNVSSAAEVENSDIAIIGMAARLPGASDVDAYWQNLSAGVESVRFFTDQELIDAGADPERVANPNYVKASAVLEDIDQFDASFFGYSRREALFLDPQQRLFLECAWTAMERAGQDLTNSQYPVGVYAGVGMNTYVLDQLSSSRKSLGDVGAFQLMIGNDKDFMPTRVAYKLNLKGPAVNVQTACSTSLVAIHMACRGLLEGNSRVALAGGVSVRIPHIVGYLHEEGMIYAPDGHCRSFDEKAQGTVFGSGVGVVVLKRLADAQADGDHIHAVIKGSAINNDGADKIGYTAPSVDGQADVIRKAQLVAGVSADSIGYVEAHGTATPLGDPVEIRALTRAFRKTTDQNQFCAIGSAKSNIGHVDAAAGVAGLIKAALALENELIPPSLHYERPNPQIDFESSPFHVAREAKPWPRVEQARRAGVSSFGIGGTNCHVVLEESPEVGGSEGSVRSRQVLKLSARDGQALSELARSYASHLLTLPSDRLSDACFTANTGRTDFEHRLAVEGEDAEALSAALTKFAEGGRSPALVSGQVQSRHPKVAVLFTGQGAQYAGMGRELYASEPVFKEALERCDAILKDCSSISLLESMFDESGGDALNETGLTQPALFSIEYALWCLWESWGLRATAVMGHSVGEYVAACVAGVFSLEDGLALIAERGRLMQALPSGGGMVSVFADESQVLAAIEPFKDQVSIAALNSPSQTVISGESGALESVVESLSGQEIKCQSLSVSHAFHSQLMAPMLDEFESFVSQRTMHRPQLEVMSNLSGELEDERLTTPAYWRDHVREAVRFSTGVQKLSSLGTTTFVELGPQPVLSGLGARCVDDAGTVFLSSLRKGKSDGMMMGRSLAGLYVRGVPVDWSAYYALQSHRRVPLPTYPFQRQRYWVENEPETAQLQGVANAHPLLGAPLSLPQSDEVRFQATASRHSPPYVEDHRVFGTLIVPGASHICLFLTGAGEGFGLDQCELQDMFFVQPLTLSEQGSRQVQLIYKPRHDGSYGFTLTSLQEESAADDPDGWVVHASGNLMPKPPLPDPSDAEYIALDAIRSRCTTESTGQDFYDNFWVQGDDAGPSFRWIDQIWQGEGEALCSTRRPDIDQDTSPYPIYPGLIEACLQILRSAREFESARLLKENGIIFVPFSLGKLRFFGKPESDELFCYARIRDDQGKEEASAVGDLWLSDATGRVIAHFDGFECRKLTLETLAPSLQSREQSWYHEIAWQPLKAGKLAADQTPDAFVVADPSAVADLQAKVSEAGLIANVVSLAEADSVASDPQLQNVVYWAHSSSSGTSSQSMPSAVADECDALLQMAQTLSKTDQRHPPRFWIVTADSQSVRPEDTQLRLSQSGLWGMARVFTLEHPEWQCSLIDIEADHSEPLSEVARAMAGAGNENQIARRNGQTLVARLSKQAVSAKPIQRELPIHQDGGYLITGGLGDLGLRCALWLADKGAGCVALMGRSEPTESARRKIRDIEALGTRVVTLTADVSDRASLEDALSQVPLALRGILHAAGTLDDGVIEQQSRARFDTVLAPKVQGTLNLDELTADAAIDFFVVFSSATSVLGAGGQTNYAAANAFLDGFAAHRSHQGKPTVAVNWGPWSEVGMASRQNEAIKRRMANHGWGWIDPEGGMQVLEDLLVRDVSSSAILPIRWERYLPHLPGSEPLPFYAALLPRKRARRAGPSVPQVVAADVRKKILAAPENRRRDSVREYVTQTMTQVLSLDPSSDAIDPQQGFTEMGMDSLMGIELRRTLQDQLDISLPSTFSFDHPNVEAATDHLLSLLFVESEPEIEETKPTAPETPIPEASDDALEAELAKLEASLRGDT